MKIVASNSFIYGIEALQRVIDEYEIDAGVVVKEGLSNVNAQPVGMKETHTGALNRMKSCGANKGELVVSIENGILVSGEEEDRKVEDFFIVLLAKDDEALFWKRTQTVIFPADPYHGAEAIGFDEFTVREFFEAGGFVQEGVDPYLLFGDNKKSQADVIYEVIVSGFFELGLINSK